MSAGSPAGKRKRTDEDEGQGTNEPTPTDGLSPSQLASNLRSGSLDSLRQTLTSIRQATAVDLEEDSGLVGPNDRRLVFARELLQDRGVASLFDAWSRVHDSGVPTLQPLPVFVLANLVSLLSCHLTDHPVCLDLIKPVLPPTSAADEATSFWQKLHSYLLNFAPQSRSNGPSSIQGRSSEVLVLASLQSLTAIVRFESGRFARSIVEHIAWNAKSVARLATMRKKTSKDKSSKSTTTSKSATFARPDIRLSFAMFLMALLHPSPLPDLDNDERSTAVDSGASTSTKLLVLNQEYGFSHLAALVKSISDDSVSVALRLLHTFERALLRDTRLPRGSLISLVRNTDLLLLLLRVGQKSDALEDLTMRMLTELCTKQGRGICFVDNGWYGRGTGLNGSAAIEQLDSNSFDDALVHDEPGPAASSAAAAGIFNPLLSAFIQHYEFSPLYNTTHRFLLFAILDAAKELQPIYTSSTRGVFGAGRLEPPLTPVAAEGKSKTSTLESGARLSGLLANRLLGQLLDLDLPDFRPQRLPSTSKLVAGVLPAVITRANLAKGVRHHDRLVRWSTLDLLQRLLERLLRFEQMVETLSRHEQGWILLAGSVIKEAGRRLPDAASILSFLEESQQASPDQPDHLLVEASLHAVALLLQYQRCRSSGDGQLSYDCRKLLSLPHMQSSQAFEAGEITMKEANEENEDDSKAFEPLIQRHTLRILRLAGVPILGASNSSDKNGGSTFARLISLALSPRATPDLCEEAMHLLTASLGSTYGSEDDASASSLLFEGDAGEFEAWAAALCPADGSMGHAAVVSLLEECLNRASRNSYRYLELARELVDDTTQSADEALPVSPLFMCFIEQVQIKLGKTLFASEDVTRAVLGFLCKLCPLLVGRGRIAVESALLRAVENLAQAASSESTDLAKNTKQLVGQTVTVCSVLAGKPPALTSRSQAPKASANDDLSSVDARPLSQAQQQALLRSLAKLDDNELVATAPSLLLLDVVSENVLTAVQASQLKKGSCRLPPSIFILHALAVKSIPLDVMDKIVFTREPAALQRLSLQVLVKQLDRAAEQPWAAEVFAHLMSFATEVLDDPIWRAMVFAQPAFARVLRHNSNVLLMLVTALVPRRTASSEQSGLLWVSPLIEAALDALEGSKTASDMDDLLDSVRTLLPSMSTDELGAVEAAILKGIEGADSSQCLQRLQTLRIIIGLRGSSTSTKSTKQVARLLSLPLSYKGDVEIAQVTAAIVTDLLGSSASGSTMSLSPRKALAPSDNLDLSWITRLQTGKDALQTALIYSLQGAASQFLKTVISSKADEIAALVEEMPSSVRALLDVRLAVGGDASAKETQPLFDAIAIPLTRLCFNRDHSIGVLASDCFGMLCSLAQQVDSTETASAADSLLTTLMDEMPDKAGQVFQFGVIRFGAALARQNGTSISKADLLQILLDRGLAWLVRRFAEDDVDSSELLEVIDSFTILVHQAAVCGLAVPKAHLAEPVIEAGIKRRITERRPMELIQVLVKHAALKPGSAAAQLATLLAHPQFKAVTNVTSEQQPIESVGRPILVTLAYNLVTKAPEQCLSVPTAQNLMMIYGGTLSLSDRLLFHLFEQMEQTSGRTSFANLGRRWQTGTTSSTSSVMAKGSTLGSLLSLDPLRCFNTCTSFPRERVFGHLTSGSTAVVNNKDSVSDANTDPATEARQREMYDPLWVLSLLSATLSEEGSSLTGLQWLSILRTNALGVAVCALSSKISGIRELAWTLLGRAYGGISQTDLQEKEHILMAMDAIKNNLDVTSSDVGEVELDPMAFTATYFVAHQLRLLSSPSSIFYPLFSRFLLQRPTFDPTDVPMFYTMLQSTESANWRSMRIWMLRYLRDVANNGGSSDWKVLKRRFVVELLMRMYDGTREAEEMTTASVGGGSEKTATGLVTMRQTRALIEEILLCLVGRGDVAFELLSRKGLLTWISQQVAANAGKASESIDAEDFESERTDYWLVLLHRALSSVRSLQQLDRSTSSTWVPLVLALLVDLSSHERGSRSTTCLVDLLHIICPHLEGLVQVDTIQDEANQDDPAKSVQQPSSPLLDDLPGTLRMLSKLISRAQEAIQSASDKARSQADSEGEQNEEVEATRQASDSGDVGRVSKSAHQLLDCVLVLQRCSGSSYLADATRQSLTGLFRRGLALVSATESMGSGKESEATEIRRSALSLALSSREE